VTSTDVLIVGAGAYGLASAWWMSQARTGARIMVVDAGEFASGASGRNGAGFRMQWGLELNIRLCQESTRFFETAAEQLDYAGGLDLKQDGYLVLAHNERVFGTLDASVQTQHRFGVPSEILDADACVKMVPALRRDRLVGGSFCHKDGTISPFRWLDALLKACRRAGVDVRYGARVDRIARNGAGFDVEIAGEVVSAGKVLLCTDWAVPQLLEPLGIQLPVSSLPKEAIATVPTVPMIKPIIISMEHHISVNQVERGSIIFVPSRAREGNETASTPGFLEFAAKKIVDLLPGVADVPVLRTWGGVSSLTPDMQPILGETEMEGLYVAVSSYRGLMTSPAVGRMMAGLVLEEGTNDPILAQLSPRRFTTGDLIVEPLLNQE
jgi:sarcosine oxidase subunit beta